MRLPFTYKIQDLLIRNNFEELEALRLANQITQLPKNPRDGQRLLYQAQAGPPIRQWIMEYSDQAKVWFWVGGSPIYAEVETDQQVAAGTAIFVDLATVGPSLTVPFAGSYEVEWGYNGYNATGAANITLQANVHVNGTNQGTYFVQSNTNAGSAASTMRKKAPLTLAANDVVKLMYLRHTVVTQNYRARWLFLRPLTLNP